MKLKLYFFTLSLLCQFIIFGQAIDQQNSPDDTSFIGTNFPYAGGQSFTAGVTGNLTQIDLKIDSKSFTAVDGSFDLLIYSGNGYNGTLLNTTTLDVLLDFGVQNISFTLSSPVAITSGDFYTISLIMNENISMDTRITMGDTYSNGGLYFLDGNDGFYTFGDLWFITYVTTGPDAPTASAQSFCESATVSNLQATGTDLKWYTTETGGTNLSTTADLATATYYVSQTEDGTESDRTPVSVTINEAPTVTIGEAIVSFCANEDATITATATEFETAKDFQGDFAPSNWSSSTFLSNGFVDDTNAPHSIQVWGSNTYSGNLGDTEYTIQCVLETTFSFAWNYVSGGSASDDYPIVRISGIPTLFEGFDLSGSTSQSGTMTITVPENSYFTFTMRTLTNHNGGANVTISNFLATTNTSLSAYSWAATEGGTIAGSTTSASIIPATSGTYTVTTTGASGCEATDSVDVTINEAPHAPTANSVQIYTGEATIADLTATGTDLLWYDVATNGTSLDLSDSLVDGTTYYVSQTTTCGESLKTAITVKEISEASQAFCGAATVDDLTSTPSADATVSWYSEATGGTALDNTAALTTGTYYIEESVASSVTTLSSDLNNLNGVAVQSDGKILVSNYTDSYIKRMNPDGTGVENLGSGFSSVVGLALQADGKILVASVENIKRMNIDGSDIEILANAIYSITGIAVQPDGNILFTEDNLIRRINADGTYTENLAEGVFDLTQIAIQADGKIVGANLGFLEIIRMNADGTSIETVGDEFYFPAGVAVQTDGKIVVAESNGTIKRMNADGTGLDAIISLPSPNKLDIGADGKILVLDGHAIKRITEAYTSNRVAINVTINEVPEAPTASAQDFCGSATIADLEATGTNLSWYASETSETVLESTSAVATGSYYVSQSINGCESTRTEVSITVNDIPEAPTTSAQDFCGSATIADLEATGTNLTWYETATTETVLESTSAVAIGSYYVSQSINGCESARTEVSITVNDIPEAPTTSAQDFCGSATIADLEATGTNLSWYAGETSETVLESTSVVETGNYYVSQSTNGCESERAEVSVTVNDIPEAPTASAQDFCGSATIADLEATGTNLTWYTSETSETVLESTSAVATGSYYVSQSTNGCESERTEVSITVNDIPEAPTAEAQDFCGNVTIADLEAAGTNLSWYASETSETVLESTSAVATGSYYVSQSTNGCESERTMVNVTISDIPEVPIVTALVTYSQGDDASVLTATSVGLDLAWYEAETGGISDSEAPTPSTETIGSTSYWVASVSDDGCYSERVEIVVTVEEVLGVGDHNILNAIKVYPNPTDGQVSIMLPSSNEVKITVYDLNGRLLLNRVNTSDNFIINLDKYEAGIYVLKIRMGQNEIIKRIIKK